MISTLLPRFMAPDVKRGTTAPRSSTPALTETRSATDYIKLSPNKLQKCHLPSALTPNSALDQESASSWKSSGFQKLVKHLCSQDWAPSDQLHLRSNYHHQTPPAPLITHPATIAELKHRPNIHPRTTTERWTLWAWGHKPVPQRSYSPKQCANTTMPAASTRLLTEIFNSKWALPFFTSTLPPEELI